MIRRHRAEGVLIMEIETRVMVLQAKGDRGLLETSRCLAEARSFLLQRLSQGFTHWCHEP